MPIQEQIETDETMARLRRIFDDGDVSVHKTQVIGKKGQHPGTEVTFAVDLGYPQCFCATMFFSNKELCQQVGSVFFKAVVAYRSDAAVRYLLQETGRKERTEC